VLSYTIASLAACEPFAYNWDKTIPGGKCFGSFKYYTARSIIDLILDVLVVGLPMPMLWSLKNTKLQKKIALSCMFGMGIFICVISALQAVLNEDTKLQDTNFPVYTGEAVLLGNLEATFSIINANLPLLQPVATAIATKIKSTFTGSGSESTTLNQGSEWNPKKQTRNFQFAGSERTQFQRLQDHLYPMSATGNTLTSFALRTENEIEGGLELKVMRDVEHGVVKPDSAIAVTSAWNVSSNSVPE